MQSAYGWQKINKACFDGRCSRRRIVDDESILQYAVSVSMRHHPPLYNYTQRPYIISGVPRFFRNLSLLSGSSRRFGVQLRERDLKTYADIVDDFTLNLHNNRSECRRACFPAETRSCRGKCSFNFPVSSTDSPAREYFSDRFRERNIQRVTVLAQQWCVFAMSDSHET